MKTKLVVLIVVVVVLGLFSSYGVVYAQDDESDCPAMMGGSIRGYVYGRAYMGGVPVPEGQEVIAVDDSGYIIGCGETLQYGVIPLMTVYQSGRQDPGVEFFIDGKFYFSDPPIGEWWGSMNELRLVLSDERPSGSFEAAVSLPAVTVTATEEVEVSLMVSATQTSHLFAGQINFDPETLEFIGVEGGAILPRGANWAYNPEMISEGRLVVYGGGTEQFLLQGELLKLRFRARAPGQSGLLIERFVFDEIGLTETTDGTVVVNAQGVEQEITYLYIPQISTTQEPFLAQR